MVSILINSRKGRGIAASPVLLLCVVFFSVNCHLEPRSRVAFRSIRLGEIPGPSRQARWYRGQGGNREIVLWSADEDGEVAAKFWLRVSLVNSGNTQFHGRPDVRTADYGFLMAVPTVIACQFEGFVSGDEATVKTWEKDPGPMIGMIFPRADEALKHSGALKGELTIWPPHEQKRDAGKEYHIDAPFLILSDSPTGGIWVQISLLEQRRMIHVRGFAHAFWPGATTVEEDPVDLGKSTLSDLLGWVWLQGEWGRAREHELSWEDYLRARLGFRVYASWYLRYRLKNELRPQATKDPFFTSKNIWIYRNDLKVWDAAMEN